MALEEYDLGNYVELRVTRHCNVGRIGTTGLLSSQQVGI